MYLLRSPQQNTIHVFTWWPGRGNTCRFTETERYDCYGRRAPSPLCAQRRRCVQTLIACAAHTTVTSLHAVTSGLAPPTPSPPPARAPSPTFAPHSAPTYLPYTAECGLQCVHCHCTRGAPLDEATFAAAALAPHAPVRRPHVPVLRPSGLAHRPTRQSQSRSPTCPCAACSRRPGAWPSCEGPRGSTPACRPSNGPCGCVPSS